MKEYFYLAMAVLCIGLQLVFTKLYQKKVGSSFVATVFFNVAVALISFILFLCVSRFRMRFSVFSVILAATLAIVFSFNGLLAVKICAMGNMSVYTLFLMSGGMTLPFVFGVAFLDERLSVLRCIALGLIAVALVFQCLKEYGKNTEKKKFPNRKRTVVLYYILCVLIFITNGLAGVVSKIHQDPAIFVNAGVTVSAVSTDNFLVLTYLFMTIINTAVFFVCRFRKRTSAATVSIAENLSDKHSEEPIGQTDEVSLCNSEKCGKPWLKTHPWAVVALIVTAYALVSSAGYFLQLLGAVNLDASLLYPIVTGGTIIVGGIFGRIFFREKIGLFELLSIALAFTATVLFVF